MFPYSPALLVPTLLDEVYMREDVGKSGTKHSTGMISRHEFEEPTMLCTLSDTILHKRVMMVKKKLSQ